MILVFFYYCFTFYFKRKIFLAFLSFWEKHSQGRSSVGECAFLMVSDLEYGLFPLLYLCVMLPLPPASGNFKIV